jgi:hypothetical protein
VKLRGFFGVAGDLRFNFVGYESNISNVGFVENLVTLMCDVASIRRSAEGGGGNQGFWIAERAKLVRNGLTLLLLAGQPIEIGSLYAAIASSPRSAAQLQSEEWRKKSYLYQLLCAAQARHGLDHDEFNHLFGRISGIPDSALIDEQTLEFIWKLHEEFISVRLANLFDELRTKRLLLIGNAHPDWHAKTSTGCRSHRSN